MGLPTFSDAPDSKGNAPQPQKTDVVPPTTATQATGPATGAGANTGAGVTREKTEAEREADRQYEERMEEEYAKRDGGS